MKKIIYILLFCLGCFFAKAQINLVPNHSFEIIDTCPIPLYGSSPSGFAKDWFDVRNTPDYFTTCPSVNPNYQTPATSFGYQCPANGNSYLGLYSFAKVSGLKAAQEIACVKLSDSLMKLTKYYISFKIVHCGHLAVNYATSKQGIKFLTKRPDYISNNSTTVSIDKYINNFAHVYSSNIITDTLNWTIIKGTFIADSNYKYAAIGNFFSYINSDTTKIYNGSGNYSYYFYDDICVSSDSNTCNISNQITCLATGIKEFNSLNSVLIYPNPCSNGFLISGIKSQTNLKVFSAVGRLFLEQLLSEAALIDSDNWPNGIYFIELSNSQISSRHKLIINH